MMPEKRQCTTTSKMNGLTCSDEKELKRIKLAVKKQHQGDAFQMLLGLIQQNNGKLLPTHVKYVTQCHDVTRHALYYRWKCYRNRTHNDTSTVDVFGSVRDGDLVDVSDSIRDSIRIDKATAGTTMMTNGPKCTTGSRKEKLLDSKICAKLMKDLHTDAAMQFYAARQNATGKVERGTLARIIADLEALHGIDPGTLSPDTIYSRVKRNNLTGYNPQSTSPLEELDPVLVQCIIQMTQKGQAPNKKKITELATTLLTGTELAVQFATFIKMPIPLNANDLRVTPGDQWYKGFRKRNSEILNATTSACPVTGHNHPCHEWLDIVN